MEWNVKLVFSIPPPQQGVWAQITKNFAENYMKWPELNRNLISTASIPSGKALDRITKNECLMEIA